MSGEARHFKRRLVLRCNAGQCTTVQPMVKPLASLPGAEHLSASPAVAIWDRSGQLAYFGPYSEGATCNASNSFIEPILQALIEGRPVKATHTMAVGCYCPWQPAAQSQP